MESLSKEERAWIDWVGSLPDDFLGRRLHDKNQGVSLSAFRAGLAAERERVREGLLMEVPAIDRICPDEAEPEFASDPIARALADGEEHGYARGAKEERAACAEMLRAVGCVCEILRLGGDFQGGYTEDALFGDPFLVHDHRCPQALAAATEARGE